MTESDNFEDGNRDESAIVFLQEEGGEGEGGGEKKGTITNRQMAIFHVELFGICSLRLLRLFVLPFLFVPSGVSNLSSHTNRNRLKVHF